jgi:hypothetical protein
MIRPRQLGAAAAGSIIQGAEIATGAGFSVNCSHWASWLLNTGCWARPFEEWEQMDRIGQNAATIPTPAAPPAVPLAWTQYGTYAGDEYAQRLAADREQSAVLARASDDGRQAITIWAGTQQDIEDAPPNWSVWIYAAAAVAAVALMAPGRNSRR